MYTSIDLPLLFALSIVSTHYVQQALAALRTNDPIEAVAVLILSLAREANTVPGDPTQLEGLALFRFNLLHRLGPFMQRPLNRDRIVYVFKAFHLTTRRDLACFYVSINGPLFHLSNVCTCYYLI